MLRAWRKARESAIRLWEGLREWSGDAAYEKYLRCAGRHGSKTELSPQQFYVEQLNRKYSRPNRCC